MAIRTRRDEVREHEEKPDRDRPDDDPSGFFFFPYFDGDNGLRPVPDGVIDYACPSLFVNGQAYAWSNLVPGDSVILSARITNLGNMVAYGLVTFRWAEPTAAFQSDLAMIGQVADVWLPEETKTTPGLVWIVPDDIPQHACLLAEIDSPLDPVPAPAPLSVIDRHYAQQNLIFLSGSPGETLSFVFNAANSSQRIGAFTVSVIADVSLAAARLAALENRRLAPKAAAEARVRLQTRSSREQGKRVAFQLEGGSSERVELSIEVPRILRRGELMILRVVQQNARNDEFLGSLAIAVAASD